MTSNAYISSDPERQATLDAQRATLEQQLGEARATLRWLVRTDPAAKTARKQITALEAALVSLRNEYPPTLFSEEGALQDLEAELAGETGRWEQAKTEWLANAASNPIYAIEHGAHIVKAQQRYEVAIRLQHTWQRLSEAEGRSLATFRKAHDQEVQWRKDKMMGYLTGGHSTCAFSNAIEHERGRTLAQHIEYHDDILAHLLWYENDAASMPHA